MKTVRRVEAGDAISLTFENRDTALFQIQEMLPYGAHLRGPHRIQEEIDIYNELVPARRARRHHVHRARRHERVARRLPELVNVEHAVWLDFGSYQIQGQGEEGRSTDEKTSAVHYLRFAVEPAAAAALRDPSQPARLRIDHPHYHHAVDLSPATREALADDLATA